MNEEIGKDKVWIIGRDKTSGKVLHFAYDKKNKAPYHSELFKMDGCEVEVLTQEEFDALVDENGALRKSNGQ